MRSSWAPARVLKASDREYRAAVLPLLDRARFDRLLAAGAEVTSLLPNRRLHDKLIVIDRRYVIEGSMNWSESALESNHESVSVIDSPEHAKKKLARIERLILPPPPRALEINRPLLPIPETVEIPLAAECPSPPDD